MCGWSFFVLLFLGLYDFPLVMLHALPTSMITACMLGVEINEDARQMLSL